MKRIFIPLLLALTMTGALPVGAQGDGKLSPITAANASQVKQVAIFQLAASKQDEVSSVAFSPDGSLIAIATYSTVQLWDVKTVQPKAVLSDPGLFPNGVAFSPDGSLVAAASGSWIYPATDPTVWLWDVKTGQAKTILQTIPNEKGSADSVAFSPDGKLLASAQHGVVRIWDLKTGKIKTNLKNADPSIKLTCLAFSPDGKLLAAASSYDLDFHGNAVQLWDVKSGRLKMNLRHGSTLFDQIDGDTVAFSPDGLVLASGSNAGDYGGAVRLWDVKSGKLTTTLQANVSAVTSVAFSPDGSLLAAASGGGDVGEAVILWNVKTQQIAAVLNGFTDPEIVTSIAFSPDGSLLASADYDVAHSDHDGKVRLWAVSDLAAQTPTATDPSSAK